MIPICVCESYVTPSHPPPTKNPTVILVVLLSIIIIHNYVTMLREGIANTCNFGQKSTFKCSLFIHFVQEANYIWYPGSATIAPPRYQIVSFLYKITE